MGNSVKRDMRDAAQAEKQQRALELRKRGATYPVIAKTMGCALSSAHKLVQDAIAAIPLEDAREVRAIELERLDRMLAGLEAKGMLMGNPRAIDSALRIMDLRARYLGLYAPTKHEVTGKDGEPVAISTPIIMIPPEREDETQFADGSNGHGVNGSSTTESSGLETKPRTTN